MIDNLRIHNLLDIYLFFQKWENVDKYMKSFREDIDEKIKIN